MKMTLPLRIIRRLLSGIALMAALSVSAIAADIPAEVTLFKNVNIFDGKSDKLLMGHDVLVVKNLIKKVAEDIPTSGTYELDVKTGGLKSLDMPQMHDWHAGRNVVTIYEDDKTVKKEVKVNVIDGGGRTLIPGLIDAHCHIMYVGTPFSTLVNGDMVEVAARAVPKAEAVLMRGFTTVRDMGGPAESIKKLIDTGVIPGPRILPSGPPISQTSGHFDYRDYQAIPESNADPLSYWYRTRMLSLADGVPEMLTRVRENLRMGASQIKLATGGGVSSVYDPLDVAEFTVEEIKVAVDAAEDWNTYVAVHVMTDRAIRKSIEAGVKSIEHGYFASDETLKLMAEKGVWLCPQPFFEGDLEFPDADRAAKFKQVTDATASLYPRVKKFGVKLGFGSDLLFNPPSENQGAQLARLGTWFSPFEVLKIAHLSKCRIAGAERPAPSLPGGQTGRHRRGRLCRPDPRRRQPAREPGSGRRPR